MNNVKALLIEDVWYVPGMNRNMMSVNQLIEIGFSVTVKENLFKLYECNQKLIMQYEMGRNKTLKVNVATTDTQCFGAIRVGGKNELWHKKLGHLNYKSLGHVSSKNLIHGIPIIMAPEKSCDIYMRGKQPRFPFSPEMSLRETHA